MLSHEAFREIEKELSEPLFMGLPLGATLNDCLLIEFLSGQGDWRWRRRCLNRLLMARHWFLPRRAHGPLPPLPQGKIFVAWLDASPRFRDLVIPVIHAIGDGLCTVVAGYRPEVIRAARPAGAYFIAWREFQRYDVRGWRAEYTRCAPLWKTKIRALCQKHRLPTGGAEVLSLALMVASQWVAGALETLRILAPSAVVTDFDRNHMWSCLILAARRLGIPALTLTHGIMHEDALGFSPVQADLIACWGDLDRAKLLMAGEPPDKVIAAGCPRLTRELPLNSHDARLRLGLDPEVPVVLFASTPEAERLKYLKLFCQAAEKLEGITGVVRLHPSERLKDCAEVMACHPGMRFMDSLAATLDESLAAADVVVVHGTGVGADALVKHRHAILLDTEAVPNCICSDLVVHAGCPHARSSSELAGLLCRILDDEQYRNHLTNAAEKYVDQFCVAFGADSAKRIADAVKRQVSVASAPLSESECLSSGECGMQPVRHANA